MAVRFALAAFVVPFVFIYSPGLLWVGSWLEILVAVVTSVAGVLVLALAAEGYLRSRIHWVARLGLTAGGLLILSSGIEAVGVGVGLVGALWFFVPGLRRAAVAPSAAPAPGDQA